MFDLNLRIGRNAEGDISPGACESRASPSSGPDLVTRELFPARPDGPVHAKKSRRGPRSRSSQYRGVTFYRRTGRWESHIWDCGKQVYLGGFDTSLAAARAYDRAAIKFRGVEADINFNLSDYDDMKQMMNLSKEEFVQLLRRQSNGFWRGGCKYRGVGLAGNKGYNKAAILCDGNEAAITNFESGVYNVAPNEGSHNLDLNLGTPEVRNSAALEVTINSGNTERLISHLPLEGLPVTLSEHPNLWTALIPNDCPNYDEEKAGTVGSPQVLAKWARQMQSSTPDETSSSSSLSAASSRFSSMANFNASLSLFPLYYSTHHPNTSTNDTSQYFSWLMPPS